MKTLLAFIEVYISLSTQRPLTITFLSRPSSSTARLTALISGPLPIRRSWASFFTSTILRQAATKSKTPFSLLILPTKTPSWDFLPLYLKPSIYLMSTPFPLTWIFSLDTPLFARILAVEFETVRQMLQCFSNSRIIRNANALSKEAGFPKPVSLYTW